MSRVIEQNLETIRIWIENQDIYPPNYFQFFYHWTLLNLYYNEFSAKRKEVKRVLDFGKNRNRLWNEEIEILARKLISKECVGHGRGEELPSDYVLAATQQLRQRLCIASNLVCSQCRKKNNCARTSSVDYNYEKLEALVRILYEIRCNLFHGDKTERGNNYQSERNDFLIDVGDKILYKLLRNMITTQQ